MKVVGFQTPLKRWSGRELLCERRAHLSILPPRLVVGCASPLRLQELERTGLRTCGALQFAQYPIAVWHLYSAQSF